MTRNNLLVLGLLLSLGINLFLLGGIAMRMSSFRDFAQSRPFPPNVGWIVRDLDEARQQELLQTLEPLGEEIEPYRRAMFMAQRTVNQLMSAPEYDSEELAAAFSELREAAQEYTALTHQQTLLDMGVPHRGLDWIETRLDDFFAEDANLTRGNMPLSGEDIARLREAIPQLKAALITLKKCSIPETWEHGD